MISQLVFAILLVLAIGLFARNARRIYRNIRLGQPEDRSDQASKRLKNMLLLAFGQQKMFKKPFVALLHFLVYAGFLIINIEMLEILIDGLFGTHRFFSATGPVYSALIFLFEILALAVLVSCLVFLLRRNIAHIKRLRQGELKGWPKTDANLILCIEILLMGAFLLMNAADYKLQQLGHSSYPVAGSFPISAQLSHLLPDTPSSLMLIERACWWFHIIGVLLFLNYLCVSKHLHILLAFPNSYFASLKPAGNFKVLASVKREVELMMHPENVTNQQEPATETSITLGVKDVQDLSWKNLLDAYTCTECGRCTAACPANQTGKLLSPRKIMMATRDRLEEVGRLIDSKRPVEDGKALLDSYITREEIWACTSCNACVEQCPVSINPLEIIMGLRQYAVMEEAQAAPSINAMFSNIENNGAPWKYAQSDRANWRDA